MLALFFVTLFRSFDDKNEMDNDGDDKTQLNKWTGQIDVIFLMTEYGYFSLLDIHRKKINLTRIIFIYFGKFFYAYF